MTDPSDYTAKIRAKGLDATGVTEQLAGDMYRNKGRHYMAIVELKVDETHEKADGNRKVDLVLTLVEPATDSALEEHLRELTRVGYLNRQQGDGQLAIDQSLGQERTVADVLASGNKFSPHPFIVVDASAENPICDVCGGIEASAVHSTQDTLGEGDDEDDEQDDERDAEATAYVDTEGDLDDVDPYFFVHAKGGSEPGAETVCGLRATVGKSLQRHEDHVEVNCPDCIQQIVDAPSDEADPWAYDAPEGTASTVPDPFATPATT